MFKYQLWNNTRLHQTYGFTLWVVQTSIQSNWNTNIIYVILDPSGSSICNMKILNSSSHMSPPSTNLVAHNIKKDMHIMKQARWTKRISISCSYRRIKYFLTASSSIDKKHLEVVSRLLIWHLFSIISYLWNHEQLIQMQM